MFEINHAKVISDPAGRDSQLRGLQLRGSQVQARDAPDPVRRRVATPDAARSAVIHTFRGNHDATLVRFRYQARRNGQESRECVRRSAGGFARRWRASRVILQHPLSKHERRLRGAKY